VPALQPPARRRAYERIMADVPVAPVGGDRSCAGSFG